jgi:hypothetical protein
MNKNRKAGIFALGMIIAMILFMTTAWLAFTTTNKNLDVSFNLAPYLTNYYNEQDRFFLYIDESTKLAASQAFYEIAKDAAIDKNKDSCLVYNNYFVLSPGCKPELSSIKTRFLEKYNQSLNNLIQKYPSEKLRISYGNEFDETGMTIRSGADLIKLDSQKKASFALYNFSYSFNPSNSFSLAKLNIVLDDFETIYNKAVNTKSVCNQDINCVKEKMTSDRWQVDVEKSGQYFLFKLKTKKSFFYQDVTESSEKFAPVSFNFAI